MSGEIRLVTLHHLKEKSLLLPPPFEGTLDPFQWTIANVRSDLYPKQFISIIPYWPQTSIHTIPLVWWKLGKLSVEVFNQGKPWSKRGRNWPKTTLLKSQGQCVLGVCWKVRINECTFRGFFTSLFLLSSFYSLSGCVEQKSVTGSIHQAPSHHILDSCGNVVLLLECTGHYHWWTKSVSHSIWILAPFQIEIFRLAFWSGLTTCQINATI